MNRYSLRNLLFLTLCCDLGLFSKRLISPAANILTDFLRIPGGIGTSFSLMFLVVAAELVPVFGCATLMSLVQSLIALSLGMVGSMGILSPIGYVVPGLVIDLLFLLSRKTGLGTDLKLTAANMLGAAPARPLHRRGTHERRDLRMLCRCIGQKTAPCSVRLGSGRAKCFGRKEHTEQL